MSLLHLKRVSVPRANIRDIDLEVRDGEAVVLFGRAGMGKRAVLKIAAGILKPGSGEVLWGDAASGAAIPVAYTPGSGGLIHNLTLLQNVCLPVVYHRLMTPAEAKEAARRILESYGLGGVTGYLPDRVGEVTRRLVLFARAVLISPALYIFEEPLAEIDASVTRVIEKTLKEIKAKRNCAALLSTGGVHPYLEWGDRFIFLGSAGCRAFASREELLRCDDSEIRVFL